MTWDVQHGDIKLETLPLFSTKTLFVMAADFGIPRDSIS